jgi:hypothetical protein
MPRTTVDIDGPVLEDLFLVRMIGRGELRDRHRRPAVRLGRFAFLKVRNPFEKTPG